MPDSPQADLADVWGAAMDADPATQRRGSLPPDQEEPLPQAQAAAPATRPPVGQSIAATAAKLAGMDDSGIAPFLRQTGQTLDPRQSNWCAAYVNGVLGANGVEGVTGPGRNIATSFMKWGQPVQGEPQAGDVLVLPRGRAAGALGGHVGIAMGQIADGKTGSYYLMQSGNMGDQVKYTWEPARSVVIRRAPQTPSPGQAP